MTVPLKKDRAGAKGLAINDKNMGITMQNEEETSAYGLGDRVLIKRWRATGRVVARTYAPLCYNIQCARKLHRNVPAKWVEPVPADDVIRLVA